MLPQQHRVSCDRFLVWWASPINCVGPRSPFTPGGLNSRRRDCSEWHFVPDHHLSQPSECTTTTPRDSQNRQICLHCWTWKNLTSISSGLWICGYLEEREVCNMHLGRALLRIDDDNLAAVFGGQVVSHAIVAATKTVDPEFHLHVSCTPSSPWFQYLPPPKVIACALIPLSFSVRPDGHFRGSVILYWAGFQPGSITTSTASGTVVHMQREPFVRSRTVKRSSSC